MYTKISSIRSTKRVIFFSIVYITNGLYWVGGTSFGCHWDTRWCNVDDEPPVRDNNQITWKPGEPSNATNKECLAIEFNKEKFPLITFLKADCMTKMGAIYESKLNFN